MPATSSNDERAAAWRELLKQVEAEHEARGDAAHERWLPLIEVKKARGYRAALACTSLFAALG